MSLSVKGTYVKARGCSAPNSGLIVSMHVGNRTGTLQLKYRTKHEHLLKGQRNPGMQSKKGERITFAEMHRDGKLYKRTIKGKSTIAKDYTIQCNCLELSENKSIGARSLESILVKPVIQRQVREILNFFCLLLLWGAGKRKLACSESDKHLSLNTRIVRAVCRSVSHCAHCWVFKTTVSTEWR